MRPDAAEEKEALSRQARGRFYATLINASGFLALAFSNLPPMRLFGIVSAIAIAFAFSMLADFTALPAALWVFLRQRPDSKTP